MAPPLNKSDAKMIIASAIREANIADDDIDVSILQGADGSIMDALTVHIGQRLFSGTWDQILTCFSSSNSLETLTEQLVDAGLFRPDNPDGYKTP